jgi:serine/threonine-protein kinase
MASDPEVPEPLNKALADRYAVEGEIGSGGMATVYLARDRKHDREVALKVLKPDLAASLGTERFLAEIRLTARLQHPHVVALFDSGQAEGFLYYVMPFIDGESLRTRLDREKRLDVEAMLAVARPVAQALAYAHEVGVVHRDIKPENILLSRGQPFVTDFGIAQAVSVAGGERLTASGVAIGTPAYMSPEQALGDEVVDPRSDIYSLGCVIYEMLSGGPPFAGTTIQSLLAKRLTGPPPRLTGVPTSVDEVVRRSLATMPQDRFATAVALANALVEAARKPTGPEKSLVVLPFEDISPGKDNEYFADGLTEELIADLSHVGGLRVISRTSAMMYKGVRKPADEIGRELGVRYLLEGSVRKAGDRLRITAQFIDTATDDHLWAEKYSGTLDDVFDMQEKVSRAIVSALQMKLSSSEDDRLSRRAIRDAGAYDLYLRGRNGILQGTKEGLESAVRHFEEGLQVTGDEALLHAGLGYAYVQTTTFGFAGEESIEKGAVHAARALELDQETAPAYLVLGLIACLRGDHDESVRQLGRALVLEPSESDSLYWLGMEYCFVGKNAALESVLERLAAVDPLHPYLHNLRAFKHWSEGEFEQAAEWSERARAHFDIPFFRCESALFLACQGKVEPALALLDPVAETTGDDFGIKTCQLLRFALLGNLDGFPALLSEEYVDWARRDLLVAFFLAVFYMLAGDREEAFDWLENAVDRGFIPYPHLRDHDPFFKELRGEPRFEALMARVKREFEEFEV